MRNAAVQWKGKQGRLQGSVLIRDLYETVHTGLKQGACTLEFYLLSLFLP